MYMDVRYTGFAGAKTGHMGVASSIKPVPNSIHKTSPSSSEDELVLYKSLAVTYSIRIILILT
ncbi:MAG: hypothetical protein DRQ42_04660, partial [Gammaproteobacteria bacterium]